MGLRRPGGISGEKVTSLNKRTRYLLIGSILSLIFLLGISPIQSLDIWSFLRTGQFVWEERTIPKSDIFSHTVPSHRWVSYQWLTSLLFFLLYKGFGLNSLVILKAILITATFAILLKMMLRERVNLHLAMAITLVAVLASRSRFFVRAEIISYLFTSLLLWIISLSKHGKKNYLYLLPFLTTVWVNLHPGVILGLAVLLIYALCEYLKLKVGYLRGTSTLLLRPKEVSNLWVIALICPLTTLLNPHTYQVFLEPIYVARSDFLRNFIGELSGPSLLEYPLFYSLLFLSALAMALRWRQLDLADLGIFIFSSSLGLSAQRNLFISSILAAPILARYSERQLRDKGKKLLKWLPGHEFKLNSLLSASLLFICLLLHPRLGLDKNNYPGKAYDFIEGSGIKGNVFNPIAWGSSFIWRFYPGHKVFIDGRLFVYGERFFRHVYYPLQEGLPGSEKLLNEYGVNFALIGYPPGEGRQPAYGHKLANRLEESGKWKLIYWDDLARIYLRSSSENKHLISEFSYEAIDLTDDRGYKDGMMDQAISEYKRALKINPDSVRAHFKLGAVYGEKGLAEEAMREYEKVIEINPTIAEAHVNLGTYLYEKGALDEAAEEFRAAIKIRRGYAEAHLGLGIIYGRAGMKERAIVEFRKAMHFSGDEELRAMVRENLKAIEGNDSK